MSTIPSFNQSGAINRSLLSATQTRLLDYSANVRADSERVARGTVLLVEFLRSVLSSYSAPGSINGVTPSYKSAVQPVFEYSGNAVNAVVGDYLSHSQSMLAYARIQQQVLLELIQALRLGGDGTGINLNQIAERVSNLEGEVVFLDGEINGVAENRDFVAEFNALLNS